MDQKDNNNIIMSDTDPMKYVEPRLVSLESNLNSLEKIVASLAHSIEKSNTHLSLQIEKVSEKIEAGRVTPWSLILTAAGLAITVTALIGGLAISPIIDDVHDAKEDIADLLNHQHIQDRDIGFVLQKTASLSTTISANFDDILKIKTNRFSVEHFDKYVLPRFVANEQAITDLKISFSKLEKQD